MGNGIHGDRRYGGSGDHGPADDEGPAPGVRARTDRLAPSQKRERNGAGLDGAKQSIQRLAQLADQLADAIARRDYYRARSLAGAIESLRVSMIPALASAARSGADPDALAALEADAAPLSDRLDTLIPQAPEPIAGLGVDLVNPAADAARETAWLASLGAAARSPEAHGAAALTARAGDPFALQRFGATASGNAPAPPLDFFSGPPELRSTAENFSDAEPIGGAVDPGAASVQPGTASGTTDEPLIEWRDVKRAALTGPFLAAPREVQDVLTGPLVALLRKRETIHLVINPTHDPIKEVVADVVADLANDPAYTIGFAEGAITGTVRAAYDTVKGFYDAGKLVKEILEKLATFQYRALLNRGKKAIDDLMKLIEDAPGLLEEFANKWNASDSYTRGEFQGEVIAYIVTQLAIIIAGSLAGPAIVAAGPYAKVIVALKWLDNPIGEIAELARGAKLSTSALDALHAGSGIRSIDSIAEARAASGAFDGLDDAAPMRRQLATADELAQEAEIANAARRLAAYNEITAIPIVPVRKGSAPGIDRDALYVSHADGARMPALLRTIKPDIEIKPYGKGLLVRHGADEWWLEFNDQAAALSAQRATGIDAARGGIGLPESNVATVEIWGFLGQKKDPNWTPEQLATYRREVKKQPLLWAGHVGISTDGGKTIYGLTPSVPKDMATDDAIAALKRHEAFPGRVADDTDAFSAARRMVDENGWGTRIERTVVLLEKPQQSNLLGTVMELSGMKPGAHGFGYSFPLDESKGGQFFQASNGFEAEAVRNCATFPEKLGLPIPEQSGQMIRYMPELEKWATADAPIDARPKAPPPKEPTP